MRQTSPFRRSASKLNVSTDKPTISSINPLKSHQCSLHTLPRSPQTPSFKQRTLQNMHSQANSQSSSGSCYGLAVTQPIQMLAKRKAPFKESNPQVEDVGYGLESIRTSRISNSRLRPDLLITQTAHNRSPVRLRKSISKSKQLLQQEQTLASLKTGPKIRSLKSTPTQSCQKRRQSLRKIKPLKDSAKASVVSKATLLSREKLTVLISSKISRTIIQQLRDCRFAEVEELKGTDPTTAICRIDEFTQLYITIRVTGKPIPYLWFIICSALNAVTLQQRFNTDYAPSKFVFVRSENAIYNYLSSTIDVPCTIPLSNRLHFYHYKANLQLSSMFLAIEPQTVLQPPCLVVTSPEGAAELCVFHRLFFLQPTGGSKDIAILLPSTIPAVIDQSYFQWIEQVSAQFKSTQSSVAIRQEALQASSYDSVYYFGESPDEHNLDSCEFRHINTFSSLLLIQEGQLAILLQFRHYDKYKKALLQSLMVKPNAKVDVYILFGSAVFQKTAPQTYRILSKADFERLTKAKNNQNQTKSNRIWACVPKFIPASIFRRFSVPLLSYISIPEVEHYRCYSQAQLVVVCAGPIPQIPVASNCIWATLSSVSEIGVRKLITEVSAQLGASLLSDSEQGNPIEKSENQFTPLLLYRQDLCLHVSLKRNCQLLFGGTRNVLWTSTSEFSAILAGRKINRKIKVFVLTSMEGCLKGCQAQMYSVKSYEQLLELHMDTKCVSFRAHLDTSMVPLQAFQTGELRNAKSIWNSFSLQGIPAENHGTQLHIDFTECSLEELKELRLSTNFLGFFQKYKQFQVLVKCMFFQWSFLRSLLGDQIPFIVIVSEVLYTIVQDQGTFFVRSSDIFSPSRTLYQNSNQRSHKSISSSIRKTKSHR